jgi:tetrapyrrole methylase family protein/MazG family protein
VSLPPESNEFSTFAAIIARLRAPDGCPWDREQTHASLRGNLLSECYEVLQALDEGDSAKLCEELGDLLLQIVLHAQIARDEGEFEIDDVIRGISEKIIRRHPHVFGAATAKDAGEVMHNWEELKKGERESGVSMLKGVPVAMPALSYAYEVQRRAARVGFDWEDTAGVLDKLAEEVREYLEARSPEERENELGDLLFTLVNLARREGTDPEAALRGANRRFFQRFAFMEKICRRRGLELAKLTLKEMDELWAEAKRGVDGTGRGGQV